MKPQTWNTPGGSYQKFCAEILEQPHTLIAGTTGSGKSVLMNAILYTALYKAPSQVRFVLIDPKRTELRAYRNLPHTIQYCTDPGDALQALREAVREIDARYSRACEKGLKTSTEAALYIVIDELGDLVHSNKETIGVLSKIARIGRASNVHLIAATQCPNRKTLSAEFSANCTCRVALRCQDKIESRQILGLPDATGLPMYGYGYFLTPSRLTPELIRIDMIPEEELAARVQWWEAQAPRRKWWQR